MSILWSEPCVPPAVDDAVLKRFLRFPMHRPFEGELSAAEQWVRAWFAEHGRPWSCAVTGDRELHEWLRPRFSGETELVIVAVSAGPEAETAAAEEWAQDRPDRYYFLECYAAAAVDSLLRAARLRLGAVKHFCPGYPGWPIEENVLLLASLRRRLTVPGSLEALASGMLWPKKSQLAVCALPEVRQ
ncbi:MAG: hypothetical protein C0518_01885 [Opitutus sp.]|nr:hypothetical protein [Opitutus sp.]